MMLIDLNMAIFLHYRLVAATSETLIFVRRGNQLFWCEQILRPGRLRGKDEQTILPSFPN